MTDAPFFEDHSGAQTGAGNGTWQCSEFQAAHEWAAREGKTSTAWAAHRRFPGGTAKSRGANSGDAGAAAHGNLAKGSGRTGWLITPPPTGHLRRPRE